MGEAKHTAHFLVERFLGVKWTYFDSGGKYSTLESG
jgi:hypothetical protein